VTFSEINTEPTCPAVVVVVVNASYRLVPLPTRARTTWLRWT